MKRYIVTLTEWKLNLYGRKIKSSLPHRMKIKTFTVEKLKVPFLTSHGTHRFLKEGTIVGPSTSKSNRVGIFCVALSHMKQPYNTSF
jgi:hypothetical protein